MTKATTVASLFLAGTLAVPIVSPDSVASFKLPAELAGYRQWSQLLTSPYEVPMELWMRCMAPTEADWSAARQKHGPHTRLFIRVYGNATAVTSVGVQGGRAFPVGTVIAKEKFATSPHGTAAGVAFMVKRTDPEFLESGGWQFLYFPSKANQHLVQQACASCHRGALRDYVFGQYPR